MPTTEQKIAAAGYNMREAQEYVLAMVAFGNAEGLAQKSLEVGLNAQDLARIVDVSKYEVIDYFNASGVDGNLLNADQTGFVFLLDLMGNLYMSNPVSGHNKWLHRFDMPVTDIATYKNGDLYIQSDELYRYDFSADKLEVMSPVQQPVRELAFDGDYIVMAGPGSDALYFSSNFGANHTGYSVPLLYGAYADSGSALTFADGKIYRNEKRTTEHPNINAITEYDAATGKAKVVLSSDKYMDLPYEEVIRVDDDWIIAYRLKQTQAYNIHTGDTLDLPYPFKVNADNPQGDTYVFGGSNVLQMHIDAWGVPL